MHWRNTILITIFAALPLHAADLPSTLHSLSRTYDLEVYVEEGLEHEEAAPIPDNARSLEEVLRSCLRGYSHAVRYAGEVPVELRVFVSGTGAMKHVASRRTPDVGQDPTPRNSTGVTAATPDPAPSIHSSATSAQHRPHGPPAKPGVRRTASGYAYRNTSLGKMPVRPSFNRPATTGRQRRTHTTTPGSTPDTTTPTMKRQQEELLVRSAMLREFSLQAQTQN